MLRLILLLPLFGLLPAWVYAAESDIPACQAGNPEAAAFEPVDAKPLSGEQARRLRHLFDQLDGHWQGRMIEQVCMLSGRNRSRDHSAELQIKEIRSGLQLSGHYTQDAGGAKRLFSRLLLITRDGLRVDRDSAAGDVEVAQIDARQLSYIQRYRTTHQLPEKSSDTVGAGDATPDGNATLAITAVAGATNVVIGKSGEKTKPKPARRSLVREERVTLTRISSNQLQLRQDFYSQGVFTGSSTWDLRRR